MTLTIDEALLYRYLPALIVLGLSVGVVLVKWGCITFPNTALDFVLGGLWLVTRVPVAGLILFAVSVACCEVLPRRHGYSVPLAFGAFLAAIISFIVFLAAVFDDPFAKKKKE